MAKTISQMADQGYAALKRKETTMKTNYGAARSRMEAGFNSTPFAASFKSAYSAALNDMVAHYRVDSEKWKTNWSKKMQGQ